MNAASLRVFGRVLGAGALGISIWVAMLGRSATSRGDDRPECASRPGADAERLGAFLRAGCYKDWPHDLDAIRQTGPTRGAGAPHGKVRVYYSPEVLQWLKAGRPAAGIPDGGMIYKEMYDWD